MFRPFLPRPLLFSAALLFGWLASLASQSVHAQAEKPESKPQIRIICVASLSEDQNVVLASRNQEGKWQEYGELKLRSPFLSAWTPVHAGELHLTLRESGELKSICNFTMPDGAKRVLVVLLPDAVKQVYRADVINPEKLQFKKGSALLVNYSSLTGVVILGNLKTKVKPGGQMVVKPVPEANGMMRMLAAYSKNDKDLVPCYDRYVSNNPEARDIMFLLPDANVGLKVYSLSEFGPFE